MEIRPRGKWWALHPYEGSLWPVLRDWCSREPRVQGCPTGVFHLPWPCTWNIHSARATSAPLAVVGCACLQRGEMRVDCIMWRRFLQGFFPRSFFFGSGTWPHCIIVKLFLIAPLSIVEKDVQFTRKRVSIN